MESINVAFSTTNGLFSRLIRWFTRSKASHALITFRDETLGKVFVMEAVGRGFMLKPWAKWRKHNTLVARYSLTAPQEQQLKALRVVAEDLGAEYDYVSVLGFIFRRFMSRMKNPLSSSTKLVCSEVVAKFLYNIGDARFLVFKDYSSWVPEDILVEARDNDVFVLEEPKKDDQGSHQEHRQGEGGAGEAS